MNVEEFYNSIGGNYVKAKETMMNDDFIKRMLSKFVSSDSYDALINAYNDGDMSAVFRAAHLLKGVTGNLSLTPLYEKSSTICELTRNLKENETVDISTQMNDFKNAYQMIKEGIKKLLA